MGYASPSRFAARLARVLIPVIVVLCAVSALLIWRDARTGRASVTREMHASATAASHNLDRFLRERFRLLRAMASSPEFTDADGAGINAQLRAVNAASHGFAGGISWVDGRGVLRASSDTRSQPDVFLANRRYINVVLKSRIPYVESVQAGRQNRPLVLLAAPTTDRAGRLNGVIVGAMRLDEMRELVPGLNLRRSEVSIVDIDDNLILGGSPVRLELVARTGAYLEMLAGKDGSLVSVQDPRGQSDQLVGYATVPASRWLVVVSQPRARAFAAVQGTFMRSLAVLAILTIGAIALALSELRRMGRAHEADRQRRLSAARMRIAAARLISAGERETVAQTVADALRAELAVAWCAIVDLRDRVAPTAIAASGPVAIDLADVQLDPGVLCRSPSPQGVELSEIATTGEGGSRRGERLMAVPICVDDLACIAVLPISSGRTLGEGERSAVDEIVESAIQAFDRARLLDRGRRARARERLIAGIEGELLGVRGTEAQARRLIEVLVPRIGDFATVEVRARRGSTLIAARDRIPGRLAALREVRIDALPIDPIDDQSVLIAADENGIVPGGHPGESPGLLDASSYVVVPIVDEAPAVTLLIGRHRHNRRRPLNEGDRLFLEAVAVRARIALMRGRADARDREVGAELQRSLLRELPGNFGRNLAVCGRYRPGVQGLQVGGDWFDAFELSDGRVAMCVGDVVGHGLHAATAMGHLATALRAMAIADANPTVIMQRLESFAAQTEGARMATVAYLVLDPMTGRVDYRLAGHPPPLIVTADGNAHYLWEGRGAPLGVRDPGEQRAATASVDAGSTILLFSDGLFERRGEPVDASLERLKAIAAAHCGDGLDQMVDAVLAESLGDDRQSDDVSVLAVRIARLGRFEQIVFPAVAGRLLGVRAAIRQWLESGGLRSEVVADALLAASEATANAVEHGAPSSGSPVTVDLAQRTPGICTLTVRDAGVWRDRGDEGDRGRGLEVIDKLVHRIDVTRDGAGTCLTMTIVDPERPVPTDDR